MTDRQTQVEAQAARLDREAGYGAAGSAAVAAYFVAIDADSVPYRDFCHRLPECYGRSSCPREFACND